MQTHCVQLYTYCICESSLIHLSGLCMWINFSKGGGATVAPISVQNNNTNNLSVKRNMSLSCQKKVHHHERRFEPMQQHVSSLITIIDE